jgi:putative transcriptional regulator
MTHGAFLEGPAELAALYAAGALTPDECARFEAHLAACPDCAGELGQLESVTAALAAAVAPVAPDAKTRAALLRRLATEPRPTGTRSPLGQQVRQQEPARGPGGELIIQRATEGRWEPTAVPGVELRVLFADAANDRFTALVRMAPSTSYPNHRHSGPEECLVLEGDLSVGEHVLHAGDYQYAPVGSCHGVQSTQQGCLLLITSSLSDEFV